jgi:hypothetical protein
MEPISPRLKMPLSRELRQTELPDLSKPPSQRLRTRPCKPLYSPTYSGTPTPRRPSFTNLSAKSALPNHELPGHPEQSKRCKPWKQQPQSLTKSSHNQNTISQNTPPAIDDGSEPQGLTQLKTNTEPEGPNLQDPVPQPRRKRLPSGSYETWRLHHFRSKQSAHLKKRSTFSHTRLPRINPNTPQESNTPNANQVSTRFKSQTFWNMKYTTNTARTKYWGRKLRIFCNRTQLCRTKSQQNHKRRQRSSRRIQLWHWSLGQSPHICSLGTAKTVRKKHKKKICLHGGNHFSKRRSESENYNRESESYNQYKRIESKNNIKSEIKDIEVKNKKKLRTLFKIAKARGTAKGDEVKALGKTLKEFRVEERQVDKKTEAELSVTLPPHFATAFNITILTFTIFIFIFISNFNSFVSDHPSQTFNIGDLSDCKAPCFSRQTISVQAKTTVNALANPDSMRLFKDPETQPDPRSRNLPRNLLVPQHLLSGQARKSENDLYNDPFIFNYLDFSRSNYQSKFPTSLLPR